MPYEHLLLDRRDRIATLTLNRPDKLNALSLPMRAEILEALDEVGSDTEVRVLIITGAGRGFCAGGDIGYLHELRRSSDLVRFRDLLAQVKRLVLAVHELPKPVIASINGATAGAGLNLAMACDIRLAADTATFGATFTRIGLHPDWGGTFLLPRSVGPAKACEMVFTGEMIPAADALHWGLVNRVVPAAELGAATEALAVRIARNAPLAVGRAKHAIYQGLHRELPEMLAMEEEAQLACFQSRDALEGISAFLTKRDPEFTGT